MQGRWLMRERHCLLVMLFFGMSVGGAVLVFAQNNEPNMPVVHVNVNMVQLDVAVTNRKGKYVTGLAPNNFAIYEDGIREKIAAFGSANGTSRSVRYTGRGGKVAKAGKFSFQTSPEAGGIAYSTPGASVFILFDTSNYMFHGFALARDSIAQFVRSLNRSDRVAFFSYSRDFFRACPLSGGHMPVLRAVQATVAGDDAALYDALLWTLKDAANYSGRRVIVVFSNGPDDASMVSPEDVRELAQSEGIPIYMISTREAELDPLSSAVFKRMAASTGGRAYFAAHWQDQEKAFASIRADLAHLYTISYYPAPNPNHGWRKITVKLVGKHLKKDHVRTRTGYRPMALPSAVAAFPIPTNPALVRSASRTK